jgi:hypothetical protein
MLLLQQKSSQCEEMGVVYSNKTFFFLQRQATDQILRDVCTAYENWTFGSPGSPFLGASSLSSDLVVYSHAVYQYRGAGMGYLQRNLFPSVKKQKNMLENVF